MLVAIISTMAVGAKTLFVTSAVIHSVSFVNRIYQGRRRAK